MLAFHETAALVGCSTGLSVLAALRMTPEARSSP
jgi:hypothetical protein